MLILHKNTQLKVILNYHISYPLISPNNFGYRVYIIPETNNTYFIKSVLQHPFHAQRHIAVEYPPDYDWQAKLLYLSVLNPTAAFASLPHPDYQDHSWVRQGLRYLDLP